MTSLANNLISEHIYKTVFAFICFLSLLGVTGKSSRPDVFCEKGVLKNFVKFTCARVSFLIILDALGLQLY